MLREVNNQDPPQAANEDQIPAIYCAQEEGPDYDLLLRQNNFRVDDNFMSQYLYNMPGILSWSDALYTGRLDVFWRSDQLGTKSSSGRSQTLAPSPTVEQDEDIKERIETALQSYNISFLCPMLVQYWGPTTDGGQLVLSTSHLPFGLRYPDEGLCRYRKQCLRHKYIIADGPPGRVFFSGVPEIRACVESYSSIQEYPLRDFAMRCGIKSYMAFPVFDESRGQERCVGALEVVVSASIHYFPVLDLKACASALKCGGLRTSDTVLINDLPFFVEKFTRATNELEEGLKMICEEHNIPFAQIWTLGGIANNPTRVFLSSINIFYRQNDKYLSFLNACQKSYLRSNKGVVGKAYLDGDCACFCKDVTKLSKDEYSLALAARDVNLTSCFAIPLLYNHPDDEMSLIVEIFQTNAEATCTELRTFLGSLLGTIRHHFRSFKVANDLQKGQELHVKVIRSSKDDKLDHFKIRETPDSLPGVCWSQNEEQNIQVEVDVTTSGVKSVCPERISVASACADENPPNVEGEMQLNPPHQSLSIDHTNAVQDGEENVCGPKQTDTVIAPLDEGLAEAPNQGHKIAEEVAKTFNRRHKITKEDLEEFNGQMTIDEAAESIGVSRSTFKRRCKELGIEWKYIRRKEPNNSLSMTNSKRHVADDCVGDETHSISTPYKSSTSDSNPIPHATTMQHGRSMTIKAQYKGDMDRQANEDQIPAANGTQQEEPDYYVKKKKGRETKKKNELDEPDYELPLERTSSPTRFQSICPPAFDFEDLASKLSCRLNSSTNTPTTTSAPAARSSPSTAVGPTLPTAVASGPEASSSFSAPPPFQPQDQVNLKGKRPLEPQVEPPVKKVQLVLSSISGQSVSPLPRMVASSRPPSNTPSGSSPSIPVFSTLVATTTTLSAPSSSLNKVPRPLATSNSQAPRIAAAEREMPTTQRWSARLPRRDNLRPLPDSIPPLFEGNMLEPSNTYIPLEFSVDSCLEQDVMIDLINSCQRLSLGTRTLNISLQAIPKEVERIVRDVREIQIRYHLRHRDKTRLRKKLKKIKAEALTTKNNLEKEVAEEKKLRLAAEESLSSVRKEFENLQQQLAYTLEERDRATQSTDAIKAELKQAQASTDAIKAELKQAQAFANSSATEARTSRAAVEDAKANYRKLQERHQEVENQLGSLRADYEAAQVRAVDAYLKGPSFTEYLTNATIPLGYHLKIQVLKEVQQKFPLLDLSGLRPPPLEQLVNNVTGRAADSANCRCGEC